MQTINWRRYIHARKKGKEFKDTNRATKFRGIPFRYLLSKVFLDNSNGEGCRTVEGDGDKVDGEENGNYYMIVLKVIIIYDMYLNLYFPSYQPNVVALWFFLLFLFIIYYLCFRHWIYFTRTYCKIIQFKVIVTWHQRLYEAVRDLINHLIYWIQSHAQTNTTQKSSTYFKK